MAHQLVTHHLERRNDHQQSLANLPASGIAKIPGAVSGWVGMTGIEPVSSAV